MKRNNGTTFFPPFPRLVFYCSSETKFCSLKTCLFFFFFRKVLLNFHSNGARGCNSEAPYLLYSLYFSLICHKIRSAHKQVILISLFSLYLCYLGQHCPLHALNFAPYISLLINLLNIFYGSSH